MGLFGEGLTAEIDSIHSEQRGGTLPKGNPASSQLETLVRKLAHGSDSVLVIQPRLFSLDLQHFYSHKSNKHVEGCRSISVLGAL